MFADGNNAQKISWHCLLNKKTYYKLCWINFLDQELLGYTLMFTAIHLVYRLVLVPLSECQHMAGDHTTITNTTNNNTNNNNNITLNLGNNDSLTLSSNCLRWNQLILYQNHVVGCYSTVYTYLKSYWLGLCRENSKNGIKHRSIIHLEAHNSYLFFRLIMLYKSFV